LRKACKSSKNKKTIDNRNFKHQKKGTCKPQIYLSECKYWSTKNTQVLISKTPEPLRIIITKTFCTILRKNNVSPKVVIYLWPECSRQTIFYNENRYQTRSVGFWSIDSKPNYKDLGVGLVLDPFHSKHMSSYIRDNLDVLWTCPVLHYTFADNSIGIPVLVDMLDQAKDGLHAGPITNARWAKSIARDLKNNS
jgi:hypothetical protein